MLRLFMKTSYRHVLPSSIVAYYTVLFGDRIPYIFYHSNHPYTRLMNLVRIVNFHPDHSVV